MKFADRLKSLGTETAFEVLAKAKALEAKGKEVIHLEIGEPDFDTPRNIKEAAKKALDQGYTHYGPSAGLPEVRAVIAEEVSKTRNIQVTPDQVVVTPGAKPIIFFTIFALVNPGDEVIYPNPGFPIYESVIDFIGAKPVPVKLREENDFRLDTDELRKLVTDKTKLIIINSPENPTGGILTRDDLKAIADVAMSKDIYVLTDEVYNRIIYEGKFETIVQFPGMQERTIILDGLSKTYAMTGWRIGYGVMNEKLAFYEARLMTNSNSCTASFTQRAAIEAITGPQAEPNKMVDEFRKRREVIVQGLNAIPRISCKKPSGAFYVFPNITKTGWQSQKLADHILSEAGVAVLSGTSFGAFGEGYLRLSYANSVVNIKKGLDRIRGFVEEL
jgi:aspartate/methionine/tyrosine aminotransferase